MKDILIVINTLGRAGAEMALLEFMNHLDPEKYKVYLYVLTGQGELIHEIPSYVKLLNRHYDDSSVLSQKGAKRLLGKILCAMLRHGALVKNVPYLCRNAWDMAKKRKILPDKLLWRILSDGGQIFGDRYDLAVAFLEGGSTYYVADHVKAAKKAAFVHVDYSRAGYTRTLDKECYLQYDKIFPVSDEVKDAFLEVYPECDKKIEVFHNMVDREKIERLAEKAGGYLEDSDRKKILTVGRLTAQKALEVSIEAMKLLKDAGVPVKWYVLGEGDQREYLERRIGELGLEEDFLLMGSVENPYPFMKQADIYVHASRYEGKSIAIQEAQILGKPILVSDCSGNREQVEDNVDGMVCALTPEAICRSIQELLRDEEKQKRLGTSAALRKVTDKTEMDKLYSLL